MIIDKFNKEEANKIHPYIMNIINSNQNTNTWHINLLIENKVCELHLCKHNLENLEVFKESAFEYINYHLIENEMYLDNYPYGNFKIIINNIFNDMKWYGEKEEKYRVSGIDYVVNSDVYKGQYQEIQVYVKNKLMINLNFNYVKKSYSKEEIFELFYKEFENIHIGYINHDLVDNSLDPNDYLNPDNFIITDVCKSTIKRKLVLGGYKRKTSLLEGNNDVN